MSPAVMDRKKVTNLVKSVSDKTVFEDIPLGEIIPSPKNRQVDRTSAEFLALAADIKLNGVHTPITVRRKKIGDGVLKFELVVGEQRWTAAKLANRATIPAIVKADLSDEDALIMQYSENERRIENDPIMRAEAIQHMRELGMTAETIADVTHLNDRKRVSELLSLLTLRPEAKKLVSTKRIPALTGSKIATFPPSAQARIARACIDPENTFPDMALDELIKKTAETDVPSLSHRKAVAWIEENVLLNLKTVEWKLEDPTLLPEAGPCSTCDRRSLNNDEWKIKDKESRVAHGALERRQDICLDKVCFDAKKTALVAIKTNEEARTAVATVVTTGQAEVRSVIPESVLTSAEREQPPQAIAGLGSNIAPSAAAVVKEAEVSGQTPSTDSSPRIAASQNQITLTEEQRQRRINVMKALVRERKPARVLRAVVQMLGKRKFSRPTWKLICDEAGWVMPTNMDKEWLPSELQGFSEEDLYRVLVLFLAAPYVDLAVNGDGDPLVELADLMGVEADELVILEQHADQEGMESR